MSFLWQAHWTTFYPWEQGQHLGREGPDWRWPVQGELLCAARAWLPSRSARKLSHRSRVGLLDTGRPFPQRAFLKNKERDTAGRSALSKPRLADVSGGGSPAWSGAVAALNMMPGVTWVAGWHPTQETPLSPAGVLGSTPHPTHGPRWPSGCGKFPDGLEDWNIYILLISIYLWSQFVSLVPSFCLLDEHR